MKILGRGFRMGELGLNKVTFLLFVFGSFLFFYESRRKGPESLISVFEQRRSLLLEHCSRRKSSEEASMRKISQSSEPSIKDLHFVRDLPGDLVFCLVKKVYHLPREKEEIVKKREKLRALFLSLTLPLSLSCWVSIFLEAFSQLPQ